MTNPKRATVYFDADIHRALRLRAAASDKSISDRVNEAVKLTLAEDAEDLAAFSERKREPNLDFEQFVKALKRRGKLYGSDQVVRGQGDRGR
jgi:plasmid stability protein